MSLHLKLTIIMVLVALVTLGTLGTVNASTKVLEHLQEEINIRLNSESSLTSTEASALSFKTQSVSTFTCVDVLHDCSGHGYCAFNSTGYGYACVCEKGYVTANCPDGVQCCYKQESRVKMFLLSLFVSWIGVPFFVLGMTGFGVGILLLCCCGGCGGVTAFVFSDDGKNKLLVGVSIVCFIGVACALIWSFANWIQFAAETEPYTDKNGVSVASW
jgi:hypothetical protein